jgi:hypothetical protein
MYAFFGLKKQKMTLKVHAQSQKPESATAPNVLFLLESF